MSMFDRLRKRSIGIQVNSLDITIEAIKHDDIKVKFYTGLVNYGTFMTIFNMFAKKAPKLNYWNGQSSLKTKSYLNEERVNKPGPKRKMRLEDEFFIFLMRLRLGLLLTDLSQRFCVSSSTVLRVLINWYDFLFDTLQPLISVQSILLRHQAH